MATDPRNGNISIPSGKAQQNTVAKYGPNYGNLSLAPALQAADVNLWAVSVTKRCQFRPQLPRSSQA
jgi:hypothetical protein